eukprot:GEMP01060396.1.p1 GENE.GEMP01060396.1~~GEMP01060396.1.p1  ORF type:complete len:245 (+),score=63.62 GEMP01060396.1:151-885(+)
MNMRRFASTIRHFSTFESWLAQNPLELALISKANFIKPSRRLLQYPKLRAELDRYPYILQEDGSFAVTSAPFRLVVPPLCVTLLRKNKKWGDAAYEKVCRSVFRERIGIMIASSERAVCGVVNTESMAVEHHKTFKTYTVRKEQGVAQCIADAKKGKRSSEGAQLRRRNAVRFAEKIRALWCTADYRVDVMLMRGEPRVFGSLELGKTIAQLKVPGNFADPTQTAEEEMIQKCLVGELIEEDEL